MSNDRFDYEVADLLVEIVEKAASQIDVKNGQIEKKFGNLHEYFKDSGYDAFSADMTSANKALSAIIVQLHAIGKSIREYSERIKTEVDK